MYCKKCGAEIPAGQSKCPACGSTNRSTGCVVALILGIVAAVLLLFSCLGIGAFLIIPNLTHPKAPAKPTQGIEASLPTDTTLPGIPEETERPLNMANPYIALCPDRAAYFMPATQTRNLGSKDVADLTKDGLVLSRNEIFARHGFIFTDAALSEYFTSKSWYKPTTPADKFSNDVMSDIERANVDFIRIYEQKLAGVSFSGSNPYAACYRHDVPYLFPDSSTKTLEDWNFYGLSAEEACIARNEIIARHGYTFSDKHLLEYFLHFSWYIPNTPPGVSSGIALSAVEEKNMQRLRDYQDSLERIKDLDTSYTNTVSHPLFSVKTPAYWKKYGTVQTTDSYISFRETESYKDYGGHIFTLSLYSSESEYTYLPSFEAVGLLTDSTGKVWHLVATYPTDVQFSPEGQAMYTRMSDDIDTIISTITAASGCSFEPA